MDLDALARILLAPRFVGALAAHAGLSLGVAFAVAALSRHLDDGASHWLLEHFYAPVLRAGALLVFLLLAYPALFGLAQAPPVGTLLAGDPGRASLLLGVIFVTSLLLPLINLPGLAPALVLPAQGLAGAALLFSWLAQAHGAAPVSYWPSAPVVVAIVIVALASHRLAAGVVALVGDLGVRRGVADADAVAHDAVLLILQVPAIVLYTGALGLQLG